ncbi:DUF4166 domain-containing protein [Curtobacterium sp. MCBD17_013]|uniref:DUF4166 domain-containing protein n=1 Tax=Curtobacterium sp. MCBD17_013 TaxID=2175668 RepID=UPI000DA70D14|nr:DUF4166 domain-containing protein [Curtobacterium sp. MCBD17_013]PZF63805.1 DUF4166 domain-containing protein [Curtobacterium sp. MCBD17_013]
MTPSARSPYEASTRPGALDALHPRLRGYFGAIPAGHVGRGTGVFDVVGTPRRWMWPLLAWFARDAVMAPVWERDVPFTVENRPAVDREGRIAVLARRTFHFRSGPWVMQDAITADADGLADHLGRRGRLVAALDVAVADGALRLVSTRVSFRVLGRMLRLPAAVAPRVVLTERYDPGVDRQRVSLTLSAPLVGTLYRYEGSFVHGVVPDDADAPGGTGGPGRRP